MFNQSYNPNYCFGLWCYFRSIFTPRNCSFNLLLQIFENYNVIVYRKSDIRDIKFSAIYLKCCISYFALVNCCWSCSLVPGLAATSRVLDISYIAQSFNHDKLSSISQLIIGKSRDLEKLHKDFNVTTR